MSFVKKSNKSHHTLILTIIRCHRVDHSNTHWQDPVINSQFPLNFNRVRSLHLSVFGALYNLSSHSNRSDSEKLRTGPDHSQLKSAHPRPRFWNVESVLRYFTHSLNWVLQYLMSKGLQVDYKVMYTQHSCTHIIVALGIQVRWAAFMPNENLSNCWFLVYNNCTKYHSDCPVFGTQSGCGRIYACSCK